MNYLFYPLPIKMEVGIAFLRIAIGGMIAYHGMEVFSPELMNSYLTWDMFKNPNGKWMVYMGKSSEFIAGVLLVLGLATRVGASVLTLTMAYITFFVGHGKFWYEDQHPFMFVLFGILFLFIGPGAFSLDAIVFKRDQSNG